MFLRTGSNPTSQCFTSAMSYISIAKPRRPVFGFQRGSARVTEQVTLNSWTVKCVCGPCNSGWMSNDIQTPAKPFLIPLFEDAQRRVSAWIALATIVAEFDKRSEKASPDKERLYFFKEKLLPLRTWKIWIGAYAGQAQGFYWNATMPISSPEHVPEGGIQISPMPIRKQLHSSLASFMLTFSTARFPMQSPSSKQVHALKPSSPKSGRSLIKGLTGRRTS